MRDIRGHQQRLKTIALWAGLGILLGAKFPILLLGFDPGPILNGVVSGFLIGTIGAVAESYIFQQRFRRLRFSVVLVVRVVFYLLLVGAVVIPVIAAHQSRKHDGLSFIAAFSYPEFLEFLTGGEFYLILAYTAAAGILVNFIRQINRLLGQRVLFNYLTGRYHRPVEEERIFMFLDVTSSTTIAERLGHVRYHQFINDFFYDITRPIVDNGGEIYQYVGDEVIVTWRPKKGLADARCIRCYFDIREMIAEQSQDYLEKYGVAPTFKAGMHCGAVITAEVGDIKKEIAFHGDVVNTASRIQAQCRLLERDLLVSADLLARLSLTDDYQSEFVAAMRLRGKEQEVELFSVTSSMPVKKNAGSVTPWDVIEASA